MMKEKKHLLSFSAFIQHSFIELTLLLTLFLFECIMQYLIIYLNIYCGVWAQTVNNETTTQLPGNTLALEMTQPPKTGDNSTEYDYTRLEYENTTTIQTNNLGSSEWNSVDLVSMNDTSNMTTISEKAIEITEINTQAMERQTITTTNSPTDPESQTTVIDSGNSTSKSIEVNEGEEQQTSVLSTTQTSILNITEANDSTDTPQELTVNITSIFTQLLTKSPKALNLSNVNTNETDDSLYPISDVNNETVVKMSTANEESYSSSTESSSTSSLRTTITHLVDITPTTQNSTQNIEHLSSSPEMTETTQFNEISSGQTIETSTHKPSLETTQGIQTTTIDTHIESDSGPKIEESAQTTQMPINSTENQTVSNHYYISSAPELSGDPIDQNPQNQTQYTTTDIPQNYSPNASEINSTAEAESTERSQEPEVDIIPRVSTISTSSEAQNLTNWMEVKQTSEQQRETTQTVLQTETERPIITTLSASTQSTRQTSESQRQSKSESMETETKLLTELPQTRSSTIALTATQAKQTTQFRSESTPTSEAIVSESPTQQSESSEFETKSQMTESSVGVLAANDSETSIDYNTTLKQPLTDHSLKTTQYIKPITTSIPLESNISAITVTLPNIKYISSISKEDMINIVTITFVAKSIDIFRWVSVYDLIFRNYTCYKIDPERNWCTIDRFIYLSPSPVVVDGHLIVNFVIDDSTDNDFNSYHVFAGPLIVEALKNSTNSLETMMAMKVMSLQTNMGTMVVKPLDNNPERLAKFELLVFIFTVVMFICTALLCLAVICSCAKRKSVDMNQIQLSNTGRRHTNGGFDLNSASNILRDENQEKLNHNVINLDGWVAPIEQVDCEKITKYDNLQDTKL